MKTRKCKVCDEEKPLDSAHFKTAGQWYKHVCCICFNERRRERLKIDSAYANKVREQSRNSWNRHRGRRIADQKLYRENNKANIARSKRNSQLKFKYGISIEEFNRLLKIQKGKCKICNRFPKITKAHPTLTVDHCHQTGKVRGLLCRSCNTALGLFYEDKTSITNALKYLTNAGK